MITFRRPVFALLVFGVACWLGSSESAEMSYASSVGEGERPGSALAAEAYFSLEGGEADRTATQPLFQEAKIPAEGGWWEGLKTAFGSLRPSDWEVNTSRDLKTAVCPECQDLTVSNRVSAWLKWHWLRAGGLLAYLQAGGRLSVLGSGIGGPLENPGSFTLQWKCEALAGLGMLYWFNSRTALQSGVAFNLPGPLNYNRNAWTGPDQALGSARAYLESIVALRFLI